MDKRTLNRITAVFLTLLVLVVAFMLSGSFRRTTRVVLPQESQQDEQIPGFPGDSTDALTVVSVAPDTVQAAIETLARPEQYRQTVSVQQFWSGESGTVETTAAVLTPWSRLDRQLADGRQRHVLTDGETTYIWYNSEKSVLRVSTGSITADIHPHLRGYFASAGGDHRRRGLSHHRRPGQLYFCGNRRRWGGLYSPLLGQRGHRPISGGGKAQRQGDCLPDVADRH